jgi:serine/threonine-protein kinase RsbW
MGDTTHATISEFHVRLECEAQSVPQARAQLREWWQHLFLPDNLLPDVQLAVTEAAANAVRHARCDYFDVDARLTDERLIVSVSDRGPGNPHASPGLGYGKEIIRTLATSVEFEDTKPGTRVTMRFDRYVSPPHVA